MEPDQAKTLLLYTISAEGDSPEPITVDFQVYPGGYDSVTLLLNGRVGDELSSCAMFPSSLTLHDLQMSAFTAITAQVESNGYIYAGGIWQVLWSHEEHRFVLNSIFSRDFHMMEVVSLLSTQEINLIEQAIDVARDFWGEKSPDAHWMFGSCEEMSGNILEWHRHSAEDIPLEQLQGQVWHIVFNRFIRRKQPTVCRTLVRYHPERREDAPFTVEVV